MDLLYIFQVLWKRKWLLALAAIGTAALTYYLLQWLPPKYQAEAILATGVIEQKGLDLERKNPNTQQFQVNTKLDNIQNRMRSRSSLRRLSYYLLRHDLEVLQMGGTTFQTPEEESLKLEEKSSTKLLKFLQKTSNYNIPDQETASQLRRLADDFGYDFESLSEKLRIQRDGNTDYLKVLFEAENPAMAAFVVNSLCEDFSRQFNSNRIAEENTSIQYYSELAAQKKAEIDGITERIGQYKKAKGIVDLDEEGTFLIAEANDLRYAKSEEEQRIVGLQKAVRQLEDYLQENNFAFSKTDANAIIVRDEISKLKDRKGALLEQYNLQGRIDSELEQEIDKTDAELNIQLEKLATERLAAADQKAQNNDLKDILLKRINTEIDLILAQESVKSINDALARIQNEAQGYVTDEAVLENLTGEKQILTDEYLNIVGRLNEAKRIALVTATPLEIIEYAEVPEEPEKSKDKIIAVLAGLVAAGALGLLLVVLSFFDNRLSAQRFEQLTDIPLLGVVPLLKVKDRDINQIFEQPLQRPEEQIFREAIRKLRYALESTNQKKFLFTSTNSEVGKTFNIVALAYALSVMKKKILIVDTNLKNNTLTVLANRVLADNPIFNGVQGGMISSLDTIWELHDNVHVLGNQGGDFSPAELLAGRDFDHLLDQTASNYDYVFLEAPAMNLYSDTRELVTFVDRILLIFKENSAYTNTDRNSIAFLMEQEDKLMGGILNNPSS